MIPASPDLKTLVDDARQGALPTAFDKSRVERLLRQKLRQRREHSRMTRMLGPLGPLTRRLAAVSLIKLLMLSTAAAGIVAGGVQFSKALRPRSAPSIQDAVPQPIRAPSPRTRHQGRSQPATGVERPAAPPPPPRSIQEPQTNKTAAATAPPPKRPPTQSRPRKTLVDFSEEVRGLMTLHRLLTHGDHAAVITSTVQQDDRFRGGRLGRERAAIRLIARCAQGDRAARYAARRHLAGTPRAPLDGRVAKACGISSEDPQTSATHGEEDKR